MMKEWKRELFTFALGPAILALSAVGCAPLNHTHPNLGVDKKAVEEATRAAREAASKADSAASRANAAATRAETAASSAGSAASGSFEFAVKMWKKFAYSSKTAPCFNAFVPFRRLLCIDRSPFGNLPRNPTDHTVHSLPYFA